MICSPTRPAAVVPIDKSVDPTGQRGRLTDVSSADPARRPSIVTKQPHLPVALTFLGAFCACGQDYTNAVNAAWYTQDTAALLSEKHL